MSAKILVLGATGTVGSLLVEELAKKGERINAATRDPSKHGKRPTVDYVRFDYQDGATFQAALEGVDRLFVVSPPGYAAADQLLAPFLDTALPKVRRVVTMSAAGVDANEEIPLRKVERTVERSGAAWTHLRPSWFMQNFNTFWLPGIQATGNVAVPAGEAKTAFVDARDIAASAAAALTTVGQAGKAYLITGGEALTYAEAAAILTRETGRRVSYLPIDDESFRRGLLQAGLPADYAGLMVGLFQNTVRAGHAARISGDVRALTGRAPRTLAEYAHVYRSRFAPAQK
ncbi:MAG: SDR family oxidoreductase [Deltaproteobacteria bacterium]|nr:SDR family oxidoreductase [Deltaproteobacteria bacterium]